jgi:hypothetical protein
VSANPKSNPLWDERGLSMAGDMRTPSLQKIKGGEP